MSIIPLLQEEVSRQQHRREEPKQPPHTHRAVVGETGVQGAKVVVTAGQSTRKEEENSKFQHCCTVYRWMLTCACGRGNYPELGEDPRETIVGAHTELGTVSHKTVLHKTEWKNLIIIQEALVKPGNMRGFGESSKKEITL